MRTAKKAFKTPHPPEQGAIELTAEYPTANGKRLSWQELKADGGRFDVRRPSASDDDSSYLFFRLQSGTRQPVLLLTGSAAGLKVWHNGRLIGENAKIRVPGRGPRSRSCWTPNREAMTFSSAFRSTPKTLAYIFNSAPKGEATATLPDKLDGALLAERLREAGAAGKSESVPPEFLQVDWRQAVGRRRGERPQALRLRSAASKCHAITADQKGGGAPSLAQAGKRFTPPYVVESILLPSKQVADAFRSSTLTLTDGRVLTGLVVSETADGLELLQPDATRKTLVKKDIEERKLSSQSPMPAGLVKTPDELKDLLAYLLSDNPTPP